MRDLKKVFLTAGAVAAVGVTASVGTFAGFTDSENIANNQFSTGSVEIQLAGSPGGDNVLALDDMAWGDWTEGTLTVENVGENRASYYLHGSGAPASTGANDLADHMKINVLDGETSVTGGYVSLETFDRPAGWQLAGSIAQGAEKTYTVQVKLDPGTLAADSAVFNQLAEQNISQTLTVKGTQRDGQERDNRSDKTAVPVDTDPS